MALYIHWLWLESDTEMKSTFPEGTNAVSLTTAFPAPRTEPPAPRTEPGTQ